MKFYSVVAGVTALTSSVAATQARGRFGAALDRLEVSSDVLPPKQDPWYTAPDGFDTAAPGDILRTRQAPGNLTSVLGNCSAAYNILYATTDSRYQPTWAVTTLLIPNDPQYNPNNALLSVQIPYDSADLDSSPSYSLYDGSYADAVGVGLGAGFWLSIPDYEGPLASFTAGVMSGHATLDSVRAALAFGSNMSALNSEYVLANDTKYAMYGYSGGALASEWAAELQVQYAPEMNFSGAAIGGLTPNVSNVLLSVTGTLEAGLVAPGVVGLSTQWPELLAFLKQNIPTEGPYNQTAFFAVQNQTLIGSIQAFANQDMSKYFTDGIGVLDDPVPQKVLNTDGTMGYHGVPQMPLFVYKAIHDEVSPINDTDALVAKYCGIGATIKYDRNTIGSHSQEYVNGEGRVYEFLAAIFTGTYNATGCQIQNVTIGTAS